MVQVVAAVPFPVVLLLFFLLLLFLGLCGQAAGLMLPLEALLVKELRHGLYRQRR
jgi:hypothetical protein